jgi:uncharacterized protein YdhG (YjbR/CyaY superfamily)
MPKPSSVDDYLAAQPGDRRATLEALRDAVRAAAPDAVETIAYNMPAYRGRGGQFVVSFDAFKRHYSLFPATDAIVERLGDEVRPFLAGRGTIRFPADRPIPIELVKRIVEIRVAETAASERR